MIIAFDTFYFGAQAKTVALAFADWADPEPFEIYSELLSGIADYVPGEFYKRELPCILSLLKQVEKPVSHIVVDGFVFLDDDEKPGLGARLYEALRCEIPIIGVAKTNFATIETLKIPVFRGQSKNPLFVTAIGTDLDAAAQNVARMHGNFRLPTLLKKLDQLTKTAD